MTNDIQPEAEKAIPDSNTNKKRNIIIGVVAAILLCCSCLTITALFSDTDTPAETTDTESVDSDSSSSENEEDQEVAQSAPENTPEPEQPTSEPKPTDTPAPTNTPEPTNTPTNTPEPTATPEPIILTGSGDSLADIEKDIAPALVRISGNATGAHFAVKNYDAADETIDLLVNTTDPYEGVRPLDFLDGEHTAGFEVSASGEWAIEVIPLTSVETIPPGGTKEGAGDYVFAVEGDPSRATISGNTGGSHFAIHVYGDSGRDLVVNTTDPYDGQVRLPSGAFLFVVTAAEDWSITLE